MEGEGMKHYSEREIDMKINVFLSKKLQKYPELATLQQTSLSRSQPHFAVKLFHSLTSSRLLFTHQ
jgi:hypothetical protein